MCLFMWALNIDGPGILFQRNQISDQNIVYTKKMVSCRVGSGSGPSFCEGSDPVNLRTDQH